VGKSLFVNTITYHLLCNHYHGLDGKFTVAVIEQVLQAGPEQVNDQDVMKAFLTKVVDIGDTGCKHVSMLLRHIR
jgi:hypothetical protein